MTFPLEIGRKYLRNQLFQKNSHKCQKSSEKIQKKTALPQNRISIHLNHLDKAQYSNSPVRVRP